LVRAIILVLLALAEHLWVALNAGTGYACCKLQLKMEKSESQVRQ
jgi:hypothetical protein